MRLPNLWAIARMSLLALAAMFALSGCASPSGTPAGAFVGRAGRYDYSPSVMQNGKQIQVWWCGMARNPEDSSQDSDAILYVSIDTITGRKTDPLVVLAETPKAWDATFTCNPRVIRGSFVNPLGDGATYTYAMYYAATSDPNGTDNSIGVAFSNDGIQWNKYKDPVIISNTPSAYGYGQPVVYNMDGKSHLQVFFEDSRATIQHLVSTTTDGIHFTQPVTVTRNGFDPANPAPSWGDMGYDPVTKYWYAAFNLPTRNSATVGGRMELGQYGIQMYRIPDDSLISGSTPWQLVKTFDTNSTGYESIFLAGFLKDPFGNLNVGAYPAIQLYPTIANPRTHWDDDAKQLGDASDVTHWDIGSVSWTPQETSLTLTRYRNDHGYTTTTGYLDPRAHYVADAPIAHLYETLRDNETIPFFNCKNASMDYFVSTDPKCGGSYFVGIEGYGYRFPVNQATLPIYSCSRSHRGHFVSKDANCEGSGAGTLLGYVMP